MFAPAVPLGGPAGYAFLQRTGPAQRAAMAQSPAVRNATEHFAERIGEVSSAEDLVADRRLREVVLGAFGLSEDIDNLHYIRTILEQGTAEGSLASRLTDKRYARMAEAFGFDRTGEAQIQGMLLTHPPVGGEEVLAEVQDRPADRLTLVLKRTLGEIATRDGTRTVETGRVDAAGEPITETVPRALTEDERWGAILLDIGLRRVVEAALDLPDGFRDLPEDERIAAVRAAAKAEWGDDTASRFRDPDAAGALAAEVIAAVGPPSRAEGFAQRITQLYEERAFEAAVGEQDPSLRLALNLQRELTRIAEDGSSERAKWFTIMGTPPLRQVFETAFALPTSFGTLDVDRQLTIFQDRASAVLGSPDVSQFADPDALDGLTRRFLALSQIEQGFGGGTTPAGTALAILTGGG